MGTQYTPEEAIAIDYRTIDVVNEMLTPLESGTEGDISHKDYLKRKWASEDARSHRDSERRRKDYERLLKKQK